MKHLRSFPSFLLLFITLLAVASCADESPGVVQAPVVPRSEHVQRGDEPTGSMGADLYFTDAGGDRITVHGVLDITDNTGALVATLPLDGTSASTHVVELPLSGNPYDVELQPGYSCTDSDSGSGFVNCVLTSSNPLSVTIAAGVRINAPFVFDANYTSGDGGIIPTALTKGELEIGATFNSVFLAPEECAPFNNGVPCNEETEMCVRFVDGAVVPSPLPDPSCRERCGAGYGACTGPVQDTCKQPAIQGTSTVIGLCDDD